MNQENQESIAVVIPTCNRSELLERTLHSLAECELPKNYRQLVVVENGKQLGAEAVVAGCPAHLSASYRYHAAGNKSAALNSILDERGEDLLVFFDDDVRIHPDTLVSYAEASAAHQNSFFGGTAGVDYEETPAPWVKLPPSARPGEWNGPKADTRNWFLGFNWAARASDLRACGGFDTTVGPGGTSGARGQESSMQAMLITAGIKPIFVPEAMVWHFVPKERCSPKWSLKRAYQTAKAAGLRSNDHSRRIWGYPGWTIKRAALLSIRALALSLSTEQERRYSAWYDFQVCRGFMDGSRFAYFRAHQKD